MRSAILTFPRTLPVVLCALLFSGPALHAQTTWIGTTTDWNTASNWSPVGVPTGATQVRIDNANPVTLSSGANGSAANLVLGVNSAASLTISGGRQLTTGDTDTGLSDTATPVVGTALGFWSGSSGTATVTGSGSKWDTATLSVGVYGTGSLTVTNGATAATSGNTSWVGRRAGSDGTLNITAGGGFTSGDFLLIGGAVGSNGTANVSGSGSTWTTNAPAGSIFVGDFGSGSLSVTSGGAVSVTSVQTAAEGPDSTGSIVVSGTNSTLTATQVFSFGGSGTSTVNVSNGGRLVGPAFFGESGGHGTLNLDGVGTRWTASGVFANAHIGVYGTGVVNVTNGATVTSTTNSTLGVTDGSSGAITIDGSGSSWTQNAGMVVGNLGSGTITLARGGAMSFGGGVTTLTLAENDGSTGTLNLGAPADAAAVAPGTISIGTINGGSGTALVNFNHTSTSYTFAPVLSGFIAVAHNGPGTTTLSGNNTYLGDTIVTAGTLRAGSNSAFGSSNVLVAGGTLDLGGRALENLIFVYTGTLRGAGTIGSVVIDTGGTLAPGNSAGLLAVSGDLLLRGTTLMELGGLARGTGYDAIDVSGTFASGGTLQLSLINGFNPTTGATFNLFDWGGIDGTFATLDLPALAGGLSWDTSSLYTTGELGVVAGGSAIPEPSTYAAVAGALALGLAVLRRRRSPRALNSRDASLADFVSPSRHSQNSLSSDELLKSAI